jgi:hypothetical protein
MRSFLGLFMTILFFTLQSSAYTPKEGNVSAALGPYFYKTNFEGGPSRPVSPYFGDVGLLVQGDTSDHGSLEISLFHMNKAFFRDEGPNFLAEQVELMQVGLGYRWWLGHYLSLGFNFFSTYVMSEPSVINSSFAPGQTVNTSAQDITKYGLEFSIENEVWSYDRYAVILDARYAKLLTAKDNERADHYGLMVALRYFIQEKQHRTR